MRTCAALLFIAGSLVAQIPAFDAPAPMKEWARAISTTRLGTKPKLQAMVHATFLPVEDGGLGMIYDNSRTRTVEEVWKDRRANCLSLTAFFVAACRSSGIKAQFAEAVGVSQWRRMGGLIRHEKHMVACIDAFQSGSMRPGTTLVGSMVLDFAPELRRSINNVCPMLDERALALFQSNRAIELMDAGRSVEAVESARGAVQASPSSGIAWNVLGVLLRGAGDLDGAERAFRQALTVDPLEGAACGNLESILRSQGHNAAADIFRGMSNNIRARDPYFRAFLAQEALAAGDLKLARKEIKAAIRIYDRDPEFYLLHAQVSLNSGEIDDAVKALERARKWATPEEQLRYASKLAKIRRPDAS